MARWSDAPVGGRHAHGWGHWKFPVCTNANSSLSLELTMVLHEHQFDTLKDDGLGWRCGECGALRQLPAPSAVWDAVIEADPSDHEHEFYRLDREGWHCLHCDVIRKQGT